MRRTDPGGRLHVLTRPRHTSFWRAVAAPLPYIHPSREDFSVVVFHPETDSSRIQRFRRRWRRLRQTRAYRAQQRFVQHSALGRSDKLINLTNRRNCRVHLLSRRCVGIQYLSSSNPTPHIRCYLCQGDYVFTCVCLPACLSVCLSVHLLTRLLK